MSSFNGQISEITKQYKHQDIGLINDEIERILSPDFTKKDSPQNNIIEKYNSFKKIIDLCKLSESPRIQQIINNPVFKGLCHPFISVVQDTLDNGKLFNTCRKDNSVSRCSAAVGLKIASELGIATISGLMIKSSIVVPFPANVITFGSGLYIASQTQKISNAIYKSIVEEPNGIIISNQTINSDILLNEYSYDGIRLIKGGEQIILPKHNSDYVSELLKLFENNHHEIFISFEGGVQVMDESLRDRTSKNFKSLFLTDTEITFQEFDVKLKPECLSQTLIGNVMIEADKILKKFSGDIELCVDSSCAQGIDSIDYGISCKISDYSNMNFEWSAFFNIMLIPFEIIKSNEVSFIMFEENTGIKTTTHSIGNSDKVLSESIDPSYTKQDLLQTREKWFKEFEKHITENFTNLMEEYPQLVELHELSKAFTIAKIIYSNNITYITKTLLISPCPCPSKVRMPVNYLMIKQHDQEESLVLLSGGVILPQNKIIDIYTKFSRSILNYSFAIRDALQNHGCSTQQEFNSFVEDWRINYDTYLQSEDKEVLLFNQVLQSNVIFHREFFNYVVLKLWYDKINNFISKEDIILDDDTCILLQDLQTKKVLITEDILCELGVENDFIELWIHNYNSKYFINFTKKFNDIVKK